MSCSNQVSPEELVGGYLNVGAVTAYLGGAEVVNRQELLEACGVDDAYSALVCSAALTTLVSRTPDITSRWAYALELAGEPDESDVNVMQTSDMLKGFGSGTMEDLDSEVSQRLFADAVADADRPSVKERVRLFEGKTGVDQFGEVLTSTAFKERSETMCFREPGFTFWLPMGTLSGTYDFKGWFDARKGLAEARYGSRCVRAMGGLKAVFEKHFNPKDFENENGEGAIYQTVQEDRPGGEVGRVAFVIAEPERFFSRADGAISFTGSFGPRMRVALLCVADIQREEAKRVFLSEGVDLAELTEE